MVIRFKAIIVSSAFVLAGFSASADAAVLTGGFSIIGFFNPYTCTSGGCTADGLAGSTAVDVTDLSGNLTPGASGPISSVAATGSFATLVPNGSTGTLKDFSFIGPGSSEFPLAPISSFELFPSLMFNLTSLSGTVTPVFLGLIGEGTFVCTGSASCDPTPGIFVFSGQTANNGTFSFSASEAAMTSTPEPGSMMLFGTGLFGMAAAARRRFSGK